MNYVEAKYFTKTSGRTIKLLVIHDMEMPETVKTAENCAAYFQRIERPASAHYCTDIDTDVQCVRDINIAYAAPGANSQGLHFELAGFASQSPGQWDDDYSQAMLKRFATGLLRAKANQFRIPLEYITASGLAAGRSGVTTHRQVSLCWRKTDHTDPGPFFPMSQVLAWAKGTATLEEELSVSEAAEIRKELGQLREDLTVFGTTGLEQTVEKFAERQRDGLASLQNDITPKLNAILERLPANS